LVDGELDLHSSAGGLEPTGELPVRPLDSLSFDRRVAVVKIDAEGFEMDILAGAEEFVARHRPVFLGEFSEHWMRSRGQAVDAPFAWAAAHGYRVQAVSLQRTGMVLKRTRLELSAIESAHQRGTTELLLTPR
jgi:hypothetical protein